MANNLRVTYNLDCEFLRYTLPNDTICNSLKVKTLKGIHMYRKDFTPQMKKCSPWGSEK